MSLQENLGSAGETTRHKNCFQFRGNFGLTVDFEVSIERLKKKRRGEFKDQNQT